MGSFPFQLTKSDLIKILKDTSLVALAAALTFVVQSVIPSIAITSPLGLAILPLITAGLNAAIKYVNDTRSEEQKKVLSTDDYKKLPVEQRRIERLKVAG